MRAAGGGNGETHFTVQIVSEKFEGLVRFLFVGFLLFSRKTDPFPSSANDPATPTRQ
jgi:hypothetical protein